MSVLIVVDNPKDWPLQIPGVAVVSARAYLTEPEHGDNHSVKVFNLCRSYSYQSLGYYVSLLAEARGHKPLPKVGTMEDLQSRNLVRLLTEDVDDLIQHLLAPIKSDSFELSIYFGRNVTSRYDVLSHKLFGMLQAPLLRAQFERHREHWRIRGIRAIAASDIPPLHQDFVVQAAIDYFAGRGQRPRKRSPPRFDLAILHDPTNPEPPSNARAMQKFQTAAEALGMRAELITRADIGRLPEFDALFIRDTTYANHYTYRFSRRATAEGLVVIDDPDSILKCNNKVYLAELLAQHRLPAPKTLVVHRDNVSDIIPTLGLPCVLKQPDSSFSRGVVKVKAEDELAPKVSALLAESDLIIAQEWLPTEFDWRVGILDRRVLFVAKYLFPPGHWQIVRRDAQRRIIEEGATLAVSVGEVPAKVVKTALKAANLIGSGFYGVDLKQAGERLAVIEINDNPNVDAGNEDGVLKSALYREVMGVFLRRIEARKQGAGS
ncbi:MAG TPA: RimK family protein [Thiobacillaceae bacterium]|nr:RimK family protein [Thiobacillaceae bacterium]